MPNFLTKIFTKLATDCLVLPKKDVEPLWKPGEKWIFVEPLSNTTFHAAITRHKNVGADRSQNQYTMRWPTNIDRPTPPFVLNYLPLSFENIQIMDQQSRLNDPTMNPAIKIASLFTPNPFKIPQDSITGALVRQVPQDLTIDALEPQLATVRAEYNLNYPSWLFYPIRDISDRFKSQLYGTKEWEAYLDELPAIPGSDLTNHQPIHYTYAVIRDMGQRVVRKGKQLSTKLYHYKSRWYTEHVLSDIQDSITYNISIPDLLENLFRNGGESLLPIECPFCHFQPTAQNPDRWMRASDEPSYIRWCNNHSFGWHCEFRYSLHVARQISRQELVALRQHREIPLIPTPKEVENMEFDKRCTPKRQTTIDDLVGPSDTTPTGPTIIPRLEMDGPILFEGLLAEQEADEQKAEKPKVGPKPEPEVENIDI